MNYENIYCKKFVWAKIEFEQKNIKLMKPSILTRAWMHVSSLTPQDSLSRNKTLLLKKFSGITNEYNLRKKVEKCRSAAICGP